MDKIRLLLVDDHEVIRQGLKTLLEGYENIEVVAEAANGHDAISLALEHRPDVTLMDITMPEMDGIQTTKLLKKQCPKCEILALTVHEDRQFLIEILAAGASGYVTKRSLADDVVQAIRAVANKEAFLPPKYTRMMLEYFRELISRVPGDSILKGLEEADLDEAQVLSKREKQVVKLVAEGYRSAQIGEKLGITTRTVSRHRARIMEKLGVNSIAGVIRYAYKTGLVDF
jgi:two-component system response regulator NreC